MKQNVLLYERGRVETLALEARGSIRWVSWENRRGSAILVGDRGSLLEFVDGSFKAIESGTRHNLRCVDHHPDRDSAHACGNSGTLLRIEGGKVSSVASDGRTTLRRLGWSDSGRRALVVGNGGAAFLMDGNENLSRVLGAETHLRSVAWRPNHDTAVVTGNCFRDSIGGLTPSHNLFELNGDALTEVSDLEASRADLTAANWHPEGSSCLVVGFDQTWHNATMLSYSRGAIREVAWGAERLFPTACSWNPSGEFALVGTAPLASDEGSAGLYRFEPRSEAVTKVQDLNGLGVSCISWKDRDVALIACSRSIPAYSV